MTPDRRLFLLALGSVSATVLAACGGGNAARMPRPYSGAVRRVEAAPRGDFPDIPFADWTDEEPEYLLYPGDEIEVATPTAAELTRTLKVGPDGRVALPLVGQVMAADRSISELQSQISSAYASQLVRPIVEVTLRQAGPIRVWVDGEVRTPGVIEMTGDLDAYQAVVQAGGLLPSGKPDRVALIRRGPGGSRMLRVVDLRPRRGEVVALRRGDIIYVPRSTLGELAAFFTQVRAAMPIGFSYAINGSNGSGFAQF